MAKTNQLNLRVEKAFIEAIDDWRRSQPRIPARAEAIRLLTLRGAMVDRYLSVILSRAINDLLQSGVLTQGADEDVYRRLQEVVQQALDRTALEELSRNYGEQPADGRQPAEDDRSAQSPETPVRETGEPRILPSSRSYAGNRS